MTRFMMAIFLVWAAPLAALAETAYVTDQLRLGLHRASDTSDRAFRTLESGQDLDVISQNRNYAQVRLPDGTVGYVKAAFLVSEKPATLIVAETRAESERVAAELERARAQFAAPAATIARLEQQIAEQEARLADGSERIDELAESNARYARRQLQYANSLPLQWVVSAMMVCLVGGMLAGMWWFDWRSRRRHGGIRVY